MNIIDIINQVEADKKVRRHYPYHALFYEIVRITKDREFVIQELERLSKEKRLRVGDTQNDKYIELL